MEDGVGIYIKKINDMIEKQINKNLKEYDLTMTQGRIIRYLNANKDKNITQKDIEKEFNISHVTVSGIISRLENGGFIKVNREKRVNKLTLLPKCLINEEKVKKHQSLLENVVFKNFEKEEKERFINDLKKIYINLKEEK